MFVGVRGSRQVAVGPMISVCPVGGAAVVLLTGWGAVVLIGAGLDVAAVVFRHLGKEKKKKKKGGLEIKFFSLKFLSVSLSVAAMHDGVTDEFCVSGVREAQSCIIWKVYLQTRNMPTSD